MLHQYGKSDSKLKSKMQLECMFSFDIESQWELIQEVRRIISTEVVPAKDLLKQGLRETNISGLEVAVNRFDSEILSHESITLMQIYVTL